MVDPLGGINTLWQLFGVGNQMLAGIALLLCTSVLVKMKRERYVWVTLVPTAWLLITTLTAGVQKIFHPDPAIGFLALAHKFSDAAAQGTVLAPAKSIAEMQRVAFNNYLDAVVCGFFVAAGGRDVRLRGQDLPAGAEAGESDRAGDPAAGGRTRVAGMTRSATSQTATPSVGLRERACAASARRAGRSSACRTTSATWRTPRRGIPARRC